MMADDTIDIVVNGESRDVRSDASLLDVIHHFDLDPRAVVVEHNREIVRMPDLAARVVVRGDTIEFVHFVGGG